MSTLSYCARSFSRPLLAFNELAGDPHRGRTGFYAMLAVGLGYTLVAHSLDLLHAPPVPRPFLAIPEESYFHWAQWFYALSMILAWVLASGVMQVLSRLLGGRGDFEETLALTGWATALGTLATLLPDLVLTSLQVLGLMDYGAWRYSVDHGGLWAYLVWSYLVLYLGLLLAFYPMALRVTQKLSWKRSAAAGTAGFLVYQGFLFLFAR